MKTEKPEPIPEFEALWSALNAISKGKKCISFDFKIRFLDKMSLTYKFRNPDHPPRGKKRA